VSAAVSEQASPRPIPRALLGASGGLAVLGVIAFLAGLASDADTAWRAFHVNYLFFGTLAQGALVVACTFVIVGARWPGPVRRLAEALGAWAPISFVLFLIGFLGRESIYGSWLHHPPDAKQAWLNPTRLFWMDAAILGALAALSIAFLYASLRPTLRGAAESAQGPARALFQRWTAGWRGDEAERERSARRVGVLAPILCLSYAFGWTFLCFDQVMSLNPGWYSNLFGAYFAWGGYLCGVAATALVAVLHRSAPGLEGEITRDRMHDLGKMIFAFSIFWMYLFFSQYLVIWYGNLPEETGFLQSRLGSQFLMDKSGLGDLFLVQTWDLSFFWQRLQEPYAKLSLSVWACCWIVPFWVLLGQRPKRTPAILGTVAAIVVLGFWLERNVLVWPSLVPGDSWAFAGVIQLGIAAGFLGAFVLVFLFFTRVVPSLPVPRSD
jgi:hypothetical protein